jgi:hypothetical protein
MAQVTILDQLRPAPGAISGRWAVGVGDTLARLAPVPDPLRGPLRLLNRFGGVAIGADAVEFDGDEVEWSDVREIRTHALLGYLFSGALERQVDRLPLPWFPFRGLVLDAAAQLALTSIVGVAGHVLGSVREIRIPAEVRYHGVLRDRVLAPGLLAALLLADPAVRDALIATAETHDVAVRRAERDALDDAERRARQIKNLMAKGYRAVTS